MSITAKSSAGTTSSASGVWKKKTYQERFSCSGVERKRCAHVDVGKKREDGRLRTLTDDEGQSVGQFLDRDALFEGSDVLSQSNGGKDQK